MRIIIVLFWIVIGVMVMWLFTLNLTQTVDVNLIFVSYQNVSLVTASFVTLLIGFTLGMLLYIYQFAKSKKEIYSLKKQLRSLHTELSSQKADPPAELSPGENVQESDNQPDPSLK